MVFVWMRRLSWPTVALFDIAALTAFGLSVLLLTDTSSGRPTQSSSTSDKRIAISFDDSPRGPGAFLKAEVRPQLLLSQLRQAGVRQAAFFVNPGRIDPSNGHAALLDSYALAGHVLANHTAHHPRLSGTTAEKFLTDVDEADAWLKGRRGYRPWFRFPELDEGGNDPQKRDAVRGGLKARGLINGYVTADGWDWFLDSLTTQAVASGQKVDMAALRNLYVETHVGAAAFADRLARRALVQPPPQVLLLHDTDLAALYLGDLIATLRADGWTIISADEAYAKPLPETNSLSDANGTRLQMLAREKGVTGPYWFKRNEVAVMKRLFSQRVLHE